ncbi:nitroreductase family deazaflavin-dependent oxidoreductase [Streptomyces sp. J2-1]|uniref:nitroreductase family deazaflavin-dependent oxidoreductase n=1 Tax=Streptomyces corallincola TaxID=2851888 RepID=UPI001C388D77|nr:nitroreductase family deazaflavin-dependent oxidoreductase [Streptomyces corallincola]MBV2356366.1 nitroreductase family deazaflavin-dependent oxidoreductase [Streptomyces corallincola]
MISDAVRSRLWKTMVRLAAKPWFVTVMRTAMVPTDRFLLSRSKGRYSFGGTTGAGTLLLTTTGRRSGQPRATPLFYKPQGDGFAVVASNFGGSAHPAWSGNLLATPRATVTLDNQELPVTARLLDGAEHDEVWRFFTASGAVYQKYLDNSGRGIFRIFLLEPTAATPDTGKGVASAEA